MELSRILYKGNQTMTVYRWLPAADIAPYLGVERDTISKWIERNGMPAHKLSRLWKLQCDEVDGWVRNGGDTASRSQDG